MKAATLAALAVACTVGVASTGMAQATTPKTDIPPALQRQAKITLDSARALATAKVPKATIASQELEREKGKLIYSFDMKTAGKAGIDEVNVDAITGKVLAVAHEGAAAEKAEAAQDRKEMKAKAATKKP